MYFAFIFNFLYICFAQVVLLMHFPQATTLSTVFNDESPGVYFISLICYTLPCNIDLT